MRLRLRNEGQMSSPFELLVAIIIMSFVVIIGSQMLAASQEQVCLSSVGKEITEFKLMLEDTAIRRGSNKFEFRPDDCFNQNTAIIKIEKYNSTTQCGAKCGLPTESCFVLIFNAPDVANGFIQKCLNLPVYTTFVNEPNDCPTDDLDGYVAIDPTIMDEGGIRPGSYVLQNVAPAAKTYPNICVFRKA